MSAFDRILGHVPFRGQILNQLAAWWFGETADIVPNHVIEVPDPNVTVAREAEPIPVEVVVRGYITGVTSTSLWTLYEQGERTPYGIPLPDGLEKNDPLPHPVITPTTKAQSGHDERLSRAELLEHGMVPEARWRAIEEAALALFDRGRERAIAGGLILVDTKYEFGLIDGDLYLIDEVHTPDSSRYWTASSHAAGDPDHMDKEFMRKWFVTAGYLCEGDPPAMPNDLIAM
ncbi:MAG: phosphoribosylaminoimidazolesuccinocarboxamide synthase, partial [Anaerolineae bacterium]